MRPIDSVKTATQNVTVAILEQKFLDDARTHYCKNGRQTGTLYQFLIAVDQLLRFYGLTQAKEFGPLCLKKLRQKMVDGERVITFASGKERRTKLSRCTVNRRIAKIKRTARKTYLLQQPRC